MWESPIYKFEKKVKGRRKPEIVTIDVTGSAPVMKEPGDYLTQIFKTITKGSNPTKTRILDFGAAKLRNTLYLLNQGFQVYAVEFPELAESMPQAKKNWDYIEKNYPNFKRLIFPKDFYDFEEKFDIALFINVLNVMPIPKERLAALALCRKKIKDGGLLFWLNWKPAASNPKDKNYGESNRLNDGWFKGKGRETKTFHVEWSREEAFEMLISTGYSQNKEVLIEAGKGSQSYLFMADARILIENALKISELKNENLTGKVLKELTKINLLEFYLEELRNLESKKATKHEDIMARLLNGIFSDQLKNPELRVPIDGGLGVVDIRFQNRNEPGFFKNAIEMHGIKCPVLLVECKNYSEEMSSPEFDQLAGRMDNPARSMLGIICCREIKDKKRILARSHSKISSGKYIIVLEDKDLERLVKLKLEDNIEEINDFMERKLIEIID